MPPRCELPKLNNPLICHRKKKPPRTQAFVLLGQLYNFLFKQSFAYSMCASRPIFKTPEGRVNMAHHNVGVRPGTCRYYTYMQVPHATGISPCSHMTRASFLCANSGIA